MLALFITALVFLTIGILTGRADRRSLPVVFIEPGFRTRSRKS